MPLSKEAVVNGFSGAAGGFVARTATSPLSVIKTTNQVSTRGNIPPWRVYGAIKEVIRVSGPAGLWRGNTIACARIVPYNALKFMVYHSLDDSVDAIQFFTDRNRDTWSDVAAGRAYAGALAGFAAVLITFPLDILKVRQTCSRTPCLPFHTAKSALDQTRVEGWRGFYRGLSPTLAGAVVYSSIQFSTYETLKHLWAARKDLKNTEFAGIAPVAELEKLGFGHHMLLGGLAGSIGRLIAYPLDVIRKRMMIQTPCNRLSKAYGVPLYKSTWDCARHILLREGVLSFWTGRGANILLSLSSSAITFAVFEETKRFLYQMDARPNPTLFR